MTVLVAEIMQTFWAALQQGEFITDAGQLAGTYRKKGTRWLASTISKAFDALIHVRQVRLVQHGSEPAVQGSLRRAK